MQNSLLWEASFFVYSVDSIENYSSSLYEDNLN